MPIHMEVKASIVVATCTGILRASDTQRGVKALWETPDWSGQPTVWDFRRAEFDLSSSETRVVAQFVLREQPSPPPTRVVFVTGREVDFGMGRMFEGYRDDPQTEFRVFRDYDKAIHWAQKHQPGTA